MTVVALECTARPHRVPVPFDSFPPTPSSPEPIRGTGSVSRTGATALTTTRVLHVVVPVVAVVDEGAEVTEQGRSGCSCCALLLRYRSEIRLSRHFTLDESFRIRTVLETKLPLDVVDQGVTQP